MTISVPADVISRLKAVLGEGGWSQDPDRLAPKLLEWRDRWTGTTPFLALPRTTADVAAVVGICRESATPIVKVGMSSGLSWFTSLCRSEPAWMMQMRSNVPQGIDSVVSAATRQSWNSFTAAS